MTQGLDACLIEWFKSRTRLRLNFLGVKDNVYRFTLDRPDRDVKFEPHVTLWLEVTVGGEYCTYAPCVKVSRVVLSQPEPSREMVMHQAYCGHLSNFVDDTVMYVRSRAEKWWREHGGDK